MSREYLPPSLRFQDWWRNAYFARLSHEDIAWICGFDV